MRRAEVMSVDGTAEVTATEAAPGTDALNRDIVNALTDLVKRAGTISQSIADLFDIAPSDLLALFKLDEPVSMKELAQRMGCDASFITAVADTLERHGLAHREPSVRDRRVKNLVVTPEGVAVKERMMKELAERMPWCYALDDAERRCFLGLVQKMLAKGSEGGEPVTTAGATTS
jgi:MarR family transcriptional regulator, organic hydroperoxide resistance regulator